MSGRPWRSIVVVAAAVGVIELARRAGAGLPDVTPLYLLAVVYAALDGGVWPGLVGVFVTFAHALVTAGGGGPGVYALAIAAPATVALATLLASPVDTADAPPTAVVRAGALPPAVLAWMPGDMRADPDEAAGKGGETVEIEREPATLAFTALSPNAERVLGMPVELAIANTDLWTSGLHPGDRARVQAAYDSLKSAPTECTLTYRVISADAGFITVRETLRPHRAQPHARVLKLVGEITRLPAADGEATPAATPSPSALGMSAPAAAPGEDALTRIATELAEPLDALTGWARLLRGTPDATTRARAADMIERAVGAQARALEPLLRGAPPRPRLVDLSLVVHAALEHTRPAAQARGITVAWSLDPALDPAHGDAERAEQIVRTMLGNAIDLAPDGARIHAAIEHTGSQARLTLSDTADSHAATFSATLPVTARDPSSTTQPSPRADQA